MHSLIANKLSQYSSPFFLKISDLYLLILRVFSVQNIEHSTAHVSENRTYNLSSNKQNQILILRKVHAAENMSVDTQALPLRKIRVIVFQTLPTVKNVHTHKLQVGTIVLHVLCEMADMLRDTISGEEFHTGTPVTAEYTKEKKVVYEFIDMQEYIKGTSLIKKQRKC